MFRNQLKTLASKFKESHGNAGPVSVLASDPTGEAADAADCDVTKILIDHPKINASTFLNVLKSKGLKIVKINMDGTFEESLPRPPKQEHKKIVHPHPHKPKKYKTGVAHAAERYAEAMKKSKLQCADKPKSKLTGCMESVKNKFIKCSMKQADSAGSMGQSLRTDVHRESNTVEIKSRFLESSVGGGGTIDSTTAKFRVAIIREGMGNLKDAYFYTTDALKSAVRIFEGKKIYADHPKDTDESERPERSVRDVLGHFENVEYVDVDGQACLEADLVVLGDKHFSWARAMMSHAIDYAKKFPDKEFVGLSINASGSATPTRIDALLENTSLTTQMRMKVQKAIDAGVETVKVVKAITNAVSCDLVTEAGAGGKILEMIESDKTITRSA